MLMVVLGNDEEHDLIKFCSDNEVPEGTVIQLNTNAQIDKFFWNVALHIAKPPTTISEILNKDIEINNTPMEEEASEYDKKSKNARNLLKNRDRTV